MAGRNPIGGLGRVLFGDLGKDVADALGRKIGALPTTTKGEVFSNEQLKIGDTNIIFSIDENGIAEIQSIRTPTSKRGQGSARNALNELLSIFESYGVNTVKLISSPLDKKTSDNKLFNFYKDMGFEDTGETANMAGDKVMELNLKTPPKDNKIGALPSNPFMAEVAAKSYMPKSTARAAREQGLDISQNQVRQIRDLKAQRAEGANFTDPLISAAATRRFRTPTVIGQKNAEDLEYHNNMLDRIMRTEVEKAARIATKDNLLFAAREARKLGYNVKKSTDRNGNVSSYYVETPSGDVRISDHELPYSPRRDFMATEHGQAGFSGFHGGELIVDHNTTLDDVLDTLIPKDAE